MNSTLRVLCAGLVTTLLLAAVAGAIGRGDTQGPTDSEQRVLDLREREFLHPTVDPTRPFGIDEGGQDFHALTPGLLYHQRRPAAVDAGESYRRRLAMYDAHATFSEPLPLLSVAVDEPASEAAYPRPRAPSVEAVRRRSWILLALLPFAAAGYLLAARSRSEPH